MKATKAPTKEYLFREVVRDRDQRRAMKGYACFRCESVSLSSPFASFHLFSSTRLLDVRMMRDFKVSATIAPGIETTTLSSHPR